MFEAKEVITEAVNALYEACETIEPGSYLTHEAIVSAIGLQPYEGHWESTIRRLRKRIEAERGITIWPEREIGYRFLTTKETLEIVPAARRRRMIRQANKGLRSLHCLRSSSMTLHQRRLRAEQIEGLRKAKREVVAAAKRESVFLKKSETRPRTFAFQKSQPIDGPQARA